MTGSIKELFYFNWEEEMRKGKIVSLKDIPKRFQFTASLSDHPIILDDHGTYRYQARPTIRWLADKINLNDMWGYFMPQLDDPTIIDDFMQFYRDIGYSLHGYEEIWAEELDKIEDEDKQKGGEE